MKTNKIITNKSKIKNLNFNNKMNNKKLFIMIKQIIVKFNR